ncbi:MAG: Neelaredoxin [Firmicutes bacterium]|jgi:superoxide reductase|nr:class II SORL domain-containing protein [Bacillota bacterium]NLL88719.1 Neelaredoxin [Bacillota bacterium]HKM17843.1 class II SORL domain-containing protein [Limnochordia bacterium]
MRKFADVLQSGDWKAEKHVPTIVAPESAKADQPVEITVHVGSDIPHPNTTEHHIRWIKLLFHPDNDKFTYESADFQFTAHGESVAGANAGPAYTEPKGTVVVKLKSSGTLMAMCYCNIHGLWENYKRIEIE